jgi:hypothetical protein
LITYIQFFSIFMIRKFETGFYVFRSVYNFGIIDEKIVYSKSAQVSYLHKDFTGKYLIIPRVVKMFW